MARMPGADWKPTNVNYTPDGMGSVTRVIVHIMQGTFAGTDAWFRNPSADVSAHFGTSKQGALRQWVDTKDRAWHAKAVNSSSIGIENEGRAGETLTTVQIHANAEVLAWAHLKHGVPLRVAQSPADKGLAWHGLGGEAWGHPNCPGPKIVAQLPLVVETAVQIVAETQGVTLNSKETFDAVWNKDAIPAPKTAPTSQTNPTWKASSFLPAIVDMLMHVTNEISELRQEIAEIKRSK